jgi:hypothetical protein
MILCCVPDNFEPNLIHSCIISSKRFLNKQIIMEYYLFEEFLDEEYDE